MSPSKPTPPDADPIGTAVSESRVARMTEHEIAYMLATAARIPTVLQKARTYLTHDLFEPSEARYILFWRSVMRAVEGAENKGGSVPDEPNEAREMVAMFASSEIATDASGRLYTPTVERSVLDPGGLLDEVYALPVSAATVPAALDLLARFVHERKLFDPIRRAFAGVTTRETLKDPRALFSMIESHARDVAGLASDPVSDAVVDLDDFTPPAPALYTTGMRWMDTQLGGGAAKKEAYVVLGGTGGGKSVLGVQLAVDGAELQAALAADVGPHEAGYWYIFTWELNEAQLRERVYAYGAKVSRNTFREVDPVTKKPVWSTAARPETLKPYEYEPHINSPGNPVMGELERLAALRRRMSGVNSRLRIVDYSGEKPGAGVGGVQEVSSFLQTEMSRGKRVSGVVFDYAGLAVQRYIAAAGLRPESEYNLLASFVDQVRSRVAVPFDCTAWVLHQLHGDVTKRAPGAKIHHSEARGCRNFADNSDFAFCLAPYSRATGLLTVSCTKHRRAPGQDDGAIVQFDGRLGAFRDPDQAYTVDPMTRQIVPRAYMGGIGGPFVGNQPTTANSGAFVNPNTIL